LPRWQAARPRPHFTTDLANAEAAKSNAALAAAQPGKDAALTATVYNPAGIIVAADDPVAHLNAA